MGKSCNPGRYEPVEREAQERLQEERREEAQRRKAEDERFKILQHEALVEQKKRELQWRGY